MNKNNEFNIDQILTIYQELNYSEYIINELIDAINQYNDLNLLLESEIMSIGSIDKEITLKIEKNVNFLIELLSSILETKIIFKNISTKKTQLLDKLSKGIKISYKLSNNTLVIGSEIFKIKKISLDKNNSSIKIDDKYFQFSFSDDYSNNESIVFLSENYFENNLFNSDINQSNNDFKILNNKYSNKYNNFLDNISDVINTIYKYFLQYNNSNYFNNFYSKIIEKFQILSNIIDSDDIENIKKEINNFKDLIDEKLIIIKSEIDNSELLEILESLMLSLIYFINLCLEELNNLDESEKNDILLNKYISGLKLEVVKCNKIKCMLELIKSSVNYLKINIKNDVDHFNLFDINLLK